MEEKKILFTSNCYGEDRSAALIASELKKMLNQNKENYRIMGASLISGGEDYIKEGIDILFSSVVPPSGGFPTRSISGFLSDIFSGSVSNTLKFIKKIKETGQIDLAVVVGDVPLLWLTKRGLQKNTPTLFLAPAKSDYIKPHYKIEEWYIKKTADYIFAHDQFTADNLSSKGLNAKFLGNPMMDGLVPEPTITDNLRKILKKNIPVIGILPGSREEAYDNLVLILKTTEKIYSEKETEFIAAIPKTLENSSIAKKAGKAGWSFNANIEFISLQKNNVRVFLLGGAFPAVLEMSDVIIGLAGTANEQAVGMGKPVVSFTGTGPQTTRQRIEEQERLLGGAMKFVRNYPGGVVKEVLNLLNNKEELDRRVSIGIDRMGMPGGARNIAEFVLKHYIQGRVV